MKTYIVYLLFYIVFRFLVHQWHAFSGLSSFTTPQAVMEKHSLLTPQPCVTYTSLFRSVKKCSQPLHSLRTFFNLQHGFPMAVKAGWDWDEGFWQRKLRCNKPVVRLMWVHHKARGGCIVESFTVQSEALCRCRLKWYCTQSYPFRINYSCFERCL